jgi:hypothetical protein
MREPGDVVVYRQVHAGKPWWVTPARVVEEDDERVVLWWPATTRYRRLVMADRLDGLRRLAAGQWDLTDAEWWGGASLLVIPFGRPYALWPFRLEPGGDLLGWYCNLQAPVVRTADGYETNDWTLDIWAEPDLSAWRWKDEDELEFGTDVGLYDADDVRRIRAAAAEVLALIEQRSAVFDEWRDWHAPADWSAPALPGGAS